MPSATIGEREATGLSSVLLAAGITTFGPLPAFFLGGLAVLIRAEFGFSETRLGAMVAVFFAFGAMGSAPAGRLADRIGAHRALRSGLGATFAALALTPLARTWWQLALALAVAGLGHAVLQVGANLLLSIDVPARMQGLAFGIKQSAIPLATLTAGAAVPAIGTRYGWRWAYVGAAAAAGLVLAVQSVRRLPTVATRTARPSSVASAAAFPRRDLLVLAVAVGFGAGSANALAAFLVTYASETGMPVGRAGILLATVSAIGLATRVGVGGLADWRRSVDLAGVAALLVAGSIGFAAMPAVDPGTWTLWVAATVAFAGGWGWPGLLTFIVARTNAHAPAAATGVTQAGIFAGAVAGPVLFGLSASAFSYEAAWRGAAVAQLVGALLILAVRRTRPNTTPHIRATPI